MNDAKLRDAAQELQTELAKYAPEYSGVAALQQSLSPFITKALSGQIQPPLEWRDIPGDRTFEETELRTLSGLQNAYANFKFAATGGEPAWVQQLRDRRGH